MIIRFMEQKYGNVAHMLVLIYKDQLKISTNLKISPQLMCFSDLISKKMLWL